jgi:hypothetical protein
LYVENKNKYTQHLDTSWTNVFHFGADFSGAHSEWWTFLAVAEYRAKDLLMDFFALFLIALQRKYFLRDVQIANNNHQRVSSHELNTTELNVNDAYQASESFTKTVLSIKSELDYDADILWENIKLQLLIYSDKFLILLMFILRIQLLGSKQKVTKQFTRLLL